MKNGGWPTQSPHYMDWPDTRWRPPTRAYSIFISPQLCLHIYYFRSCCQHHQRNKPPSRLSIFPSPIPSRLTSRPWGLASELLRGEEFHQIYGCLWATYPWPISCPLQKGASTATPTMCVLTIKKDENLTAFQLWCHIWHQLKTSILRAKIIACSLLPDN